jgi:two-component system, NarL family, response regulator DevR
MDKSSAHILLVDDHEVVRAGIAHALISHGYISITHAHSYASAAAEIRVTKFDCAIIDYRLGDGDGIDLAHLFSLNSPLTPLILLTFEASLDLARQAERAGIRAIITKDQPLSQLITLVTEIVVGSSASSFTSMIASKKSVKTLAELTVAENEVLQLLVAGYSNREISKARHNSEATIKSHLSSIYRKLEVRGRVEAMVKVSRPHL